MTMASARAKAEGLAREHPDTTVYIKRKSLNTYWTEAYCIFISKTQTIIWS